MTGILKKHSSKFDVLVRVLDPLIVIFATFVIKFLLPSSFPYEFAKVLAIYCGGLTLIIFPLFGIYRSWRGVALSSEIRLMFWAWLLTLFIFNGLIFIAANQAQREIIWPYGLMGTGIFWIWASTCFFTLVAYRAVLRYFLRILRGSGKNSRSVIIIGVNKLSKNLVKTFHRYPWAGYNIISVIDDSKNAPEQIDGVSVIGGLDCVGEYVNQNRVDIVYIALDLSEQMQIKSVIAQLRDTSADVFVVPDMFNLALLKLSLTEIMGWAVINLNHTPCSGIHRFFKYLEDVFLATIILLLMSPIMVFIAIGVKLSSPGPILFKQRRYGIKGEEIVIYKFRSMSVCEDGPDIAQARQCDPRVTPLGAFLRKTSLDELPQFINVLQGRMSVVGPRPHAVAHNEYYRTLISSYMLRHKMKPGITGLAQANGCRGETNAIEKMEKRIEYDLYYISNWSLWLDIKIVLKTIGNGFIDENAY